MNDKPHPAIQKMAESFKPLGNVCGNCKFAVLAPGADLKLRDCSWRPPTIFMLMNQRGQPVFVSEFPKVRIEQSCGEWKPKLAVQV